jgi:hypothetical protein
MAEVTINDRQMTLAKLNPDGPVDGVPQWSVSAGNGTMIMSPEGLSPEAQALWDASLPEGFQVYLVSETLADEEDGPVDTTYMAQADVDRGAGVELLTESFLVHVVNRATTLGATVSVAVDKPVA